MYLKLFTMGPWLHHQQSQLCQETLGTWRCCSAADCGSRRGASMKTSRLAAPGLCSEHVKQMLTDAALFSPVDDRRHRAAVGRRRWYHSKQTSHYCVSLWTPLLFYLFIYFYFILNAAPLANVARCSPNSGGGWLQKGCKWRDEGRSWNHWEQWTDCRSRGMDGEVKSLTAAAGRLDRWVSHETLTITVTELDTDWTKHADCWNYFPWCIIGSTGVTVKKYPQAMKQMHLCWNAMNWFVFYLCLLEPEPLLGLG